MLESWLYLLYAYRGDWAVSEGRWEKKDEAVVAYFKAQTFSMFGSWLLAEVE
jgi:hypothetical protein